MAKEAIAPTKEISSCNSENLNSTYAEDNDSQNQLDVSEMGLHILKKYGIEMENEQDLEEFINTNIDEWGMDMFRVEELTHNHPLTPIFYSIFKVSYLLGGLFIICR